MENSKGNEITPILSRILSQKADELGLALRDIQEISGVSHSTIGRIFKGETAIDIDKFSAVAKALGLAPWRVFRQAEQELTAQSSSSPVPAPVPDAFITQFEQDFNLGLYDYAAHPGFNDEYEELGEENQVPDEWEEE